MSESTFRTLLVALGAVHLALFGSMVLSPESFHDSIGGFGERNDHYIRDSATFPLAIGVGLLLAASRRSWRVPVLVVSTIWYLAHAVNHLFDIGDSDPDWVGPADFVSLLVGGILLAYLTYLAATRRAGEPEEHP